MKKIEFDDIVFMNMYTDGCNDMEIGAQFNCTASAVYLRRKQLNLPSKFKYGSRLDVEQIRELVISGLSDYDIAPIVGANHCTVFQFRKKHGIERGSMKLAREVALTERQRSILIGHVFGDGYLSRQFTNTSGTISQGEKQQLYAEWKYAELANLCTPLVRRERKIADARNGKYYVSYDAHIASNPALNWYYDQFYSGGKKVVSDSILTYYDELSLAVHFMDDGYKTQFGYSLAMHCFTVEECELYSIMLSEKFGIYSNRQKAGNVYIPSRSADKLRELVSPYVIQSMQYKLYDDPCHVTP